MDTCISSEKNTTNNDTKLSRSKRTSESCQFLLRRCILHVVFFLHFARCGLLQSSPFHTHLQKRKKSNKNTRAHATANPRIIEEAHELGFHPSRFMQGLWVPGDRADESIWSQERRNQHGGGSSPLRRADRPCSSPSRVFSSTLLLSC